jgi:L-histidine Nalpha-methyltransferase
MKADERWKLFEALEEGAADERRSFIADVERGLTSPRKRLSCRYFYDDAGSHLFEDICELEEYYLPRAEREILERRAEEVARLTRASAELVELGSGNAAKTRLLVDALLARRGELTYVPIDVSRSMLEESSRALLERYPRLSIEAIAGDYESGLDALSKRDPAPKLILWLGSNIGNFDRAEAAAYLLRIRAVMSPGDGLLIGVDLRKDKRTLEAAYDDSRGVTAAFNKNVLRRINRELGGDFDVDRFLHRAKYDEIAGRIDMDLLSVKAQRVTIAACNLIVDLAAGEAIHTESSYKYDEPELHALAEASSLELRNLWTDGARRFAELFLARAG